MATLVSEIANTGNADALRQLSAVILKNFLQNIEGNRGHGGNVESCLSHDIFYMRLLTNIIRHFHRPFLKARYLLAQNIFNLYLSSSCSANA